MNESTPRAQTADASSMPVRILLMAVLAPFSAIVLMASPLLVDAVRHAAGL